MMNANPNTEFWYRPGKSYSTIHPIHAEKDLVTKHFRLEAHFELAASFARQRGNLKLAEVFSRVALKHAFDARGASSHFEYDWMDG